MFCIFGNVRFLKNPNSHFHPLFNACQQRIFKENFKSLDSGSNITDLLLSIGIFLKNPKQSLFNHSLMPVNRYNSSKN